MTDLDDKPPDGWLADIFDAGQDLDLGVADDGSQRSTLDMDEELIGLGINACCPCLTGIEPVELMLDLAELIDAVVTAERLDPGGCNVVKWLHITGLLYQ
jgi:hypothetical protein